MSNNNFFLLPKGKYLYIAQIINGEIKLCKNTLLPDDGIILNLSEGKIVSLSNREKKLVIGEFSKRGYFNKIATTSFPQNFILKSETIINDYLLLIGTTLNTNLEEVGLNVEILAFSLINNSFTPIKEIKYKKESEYSIYDDGSYRPPDGLSPDKVVVSVDNFLNPNKLLLYDFSNIDEPIVIFQKDISDDIHLGEIERIFQNKKFVIVVSSKSYHSIISQRVDLLDKEELEESGSVTQWFNKSNEKKIYYWNDIILAVDIYQPPKILIAAGYEGVGYYCNSFKNETIEYTLGRELIGDTHPIFYLNWWYDKNLIKVIIDPNNNDNLVLVFCDNNSYSYEILSRNLLYGNYNDWNSHYRPNYDVEYDNHYDDEPPNEYFSDGCEYCLHDPCICRGGDIV
jgi:hypothetical protein